MGMSPSLQCPAKEGKHRDEAGPKASQGSEVTQREEQPNRASFIDLFIKNEILMQDLLFEEVSAGCAGRGALRGGGGVCAVPIPARSPRTLLTPSVPSDDSLPLLNSLFPFPHPEQGVAGN